MYMYIFKPESHVPVFYSKHRSQLIYFLVACYSKVPEDVKERKKFMRDRSGPFLRWQTSGSIFNDNKLAFFHCLSQFTRLDAYSELGKWICQ